MTMKLRTIGTCEIVVGETRITPDSVVLFALALYLGVRVGERVRRAELIKLFWPEMPEPAARHALRQLLYRLRRSGLTLEAEGEDLVLEPTALKSDLIRITAPSWPDMANAAEVEATLAVLPGYEAPISEPFREWLDGVRATIEGQLRRALLRHISLARREARWSDVERLAHHLIAADPLNEEATLAVAEATAMSGGKHRAVQILDEYLSELGPNAPSIGLPARVLRRRLSERTFDSEGQSALDRIFVGRESEIARIARVLEEVKRKVGGSVQVLGDAGMGKTRFAAEVRREATLRGFATINIRLHASDRLRPLSVIVDAVRALLALPGALGCSPQTMARLKLLTERSTGATPELTASTEVEVKHYQVREAVLDLLGAVSDESALLVLVDDAQNMDAASISLLNDLLPWSSDKRLLWLLASRQGESSSLQSCAHAGPNHSTLRMDALSQVACARLIELALPGLPLGQQADLGQETWKLAGGHPFFVRELVTAWTASGQTGTLPKSVSTAVADRISMLGEGALSIVQGCAILGSLATVGRVSRLLALEAREELRSLSELDSLGIIGATANDPTITLHDIWRDEVLRTIRTSTGHLLHLRAAEMLEAETGSARPVGLFWEIARHLGLAGEQHRARMVLEQCAAYLMDVGLPEDAAATYWQAAEYCESDSEKLRCVRGRLIALKAAGRFDQIRTDIAVARSLATLVNPSHDTHDDLEVSESFALWNTERGVESALTRATGCADNHGLAPEHRMQMNVLRAIIADNVCDDDSLRRAYSSAKSIARDVGGFEAEMLSIDLIFHTTLGDPVFATESAARFIEFHRSRSVAGGLCRALRFATYSHRIVGAFETTRALLREALGLAERYRLAWEAASACDILATVALDAGDIDDGSRWTETFEYWTLRTDVRVVRTSLTIARTRLLLASHQPDAALGVLRAAEYPYLSDPIPRQALSWLSAWCAAYSQLGNLIEIKALLPAMRDRLELTMQRGRQDDYVRSYLGGLGALNRTQERRDFAKRYATVRRDLTPIPDFLVEFEI